MKIVWYVKFCIYYFQVQYRQILTFPTGMDKMESKITAMKDELFCKAVLQAAKVILIFIIKCNLE